MSLEALNSSNFSMQGYQEGTRAITEVRVTEISSAQKATEVFTSFPKPLLLHSRLNPNHRPYLKQKPDVITQTKKNETATIEDKTEYGLLSSPLEAPHDDFMSYGHRFRYYDPQYGKAFPKTGNWRKVGDFWIEWDSKLADDACDQDPEELMNNMEMPIELLVKYDPYVKYLAEQAKKSPDAEIDFDVLAALRREDNHCYYKDESGRQFRMYSSADSKP